MLIFVKTLKWVFILFSMTLIVLLVGACGTVIPVKTETATLVSTPQSPTSSATPSSIPVSTPSIQPTIRFIITPNLDQITRWREYQNALAHKFLPTSYSQETVLCEWELLGQSGQEIYIWAFCQATGSIPSAKSAPAVVYLGSDGAVQSVETPGDGSFYAPDVNRLFPPDVQEKIFTRLVDVERMRVHIDLRIEHPEPPLIVLSATSAP